MSAADLLLVLAAFVLKPDADDARTETGHRDELLLDERVRPRVDRVARPEGVQLAFAHHGSNARNRPRRAGRLAAVASRCRRRCRCRHRRRASSSGRVAAVLTSNRRRSEVLGLDVVVVVRREESPALLAIIVACGVDVCTAAAAL